MYIFMFQLEWRNKMIFKILIELIENQNLFSDLIHTIF